MATTKAMESLKCGGAKKRYKSGGRSYKDGGYTTLSTKEKTEFDADAKAMGHTRKQHAAHTFQSGGEKSPPFEKGTIRNFGKAVKSIGRKIIQTPDGYESVADDPNLRRSYRNLVTGEKDYNRIVPDPAQFKNEEAENAYLVDKLGLTKENYLDVHEKTGKIYDPWRLRKAVKATSNDVPKLAEGGGINTQLALETIFGDTAMSSEEREGLIARLTEMSGSIDDTAGPKAEASLIGLGTDAVAGGIESGFGAAQKKAGREYDPREDPAETLKKTQGLEIAKDIGMSTLKGAAKGAALGSIVPGVGTVVGGAIGGAAGLVKSGIEAIAGTGERRAEVDEATTDYNRYWAGKYFAGKEEYAEGGEIKGKGGPKSDSINMKAKDGSFIVPAENRDAGMKLGRDFLGWTDDSIAARNNGGSKIKVSDGEVFFTPDEVERLTLSGVDLDSFAPNAKSENKLRADGGWVYDTETGNVITQEEYDRKYSPKRVTSKSGISTSATPKVEITPATQKYMSRPIPEPEEGKIDFLNFVPELASAVQIAGATKGLVESGKKPDLLISSRLETLASDTRKAATFGLDPSARNAYLRDIERTRRDATNVIVSGGGSPADKREAIVRVTSNTLAAKGKLPIIDQSLRLEKTKINIGVEQGLARMKYDKSKVDSEFWQESQENWANMLSTGIQNIVGARQYKSHLDYLKSVGSTDPTFTR